MSERTDTDRVALMLVNALLREQKLLEALAAAYERIAGLELAKEPSRE